MSNPNFSCPGSKKQSAIARILAPLLAWTLQNSWMPITQAETVLESIRTTGLLRAAIREDSVPFGFRDGPANQWTGICVDFIQALQAEVSATLGGQPLLVKFYQSSLFNRYNLVAENVVVVECGPNTIRHDLELPITFSLPFFVTGTQFLIPGDRLGQFDGNGDLQGERIGVLAGTSNSEFLATRYPKAELINFQGFTARRLGVEALMQGRIDAFASDGILLFGEALLLEIPLGRDYRLYPPYPLDCQGYGLILPSDQPEWENLVNRVVSSPNSRNIYRRWLGPLFPALERVENHCRARESQALTTVPTGDEIPSEKEP
ncbi:MULTISPECIES: amino acid ABC transporter substrate-binding protein [unclassified Synechocystis]|uniref:amino acid ABC transporter substrate-binding protein n=1 Tax=unclassified Synechocystis TaxID=2640012 RepID=UPI000415ADDA|nr:MULTISPECIES: amino acid ABC transporter substrate-binding protein [unclassified Synechocystis]AIE75597.1 extracellular solute-binding protein, family 3 [Synechocystis sp. PCC 6714]MCT0253795.1 amino acid ABC transporter substrate-binding protein [Synechocystis sp. CS-94]